MTSEGRVIPVEIHGQRYPIRSRSNRSTSRAWRPTWRRRCRRPPKPRRADDALRLAVLAALNIADELFRCRESNRPDGERAERAEELERLLDRMLMARGTGSLNARQALDLPPCTPTPT